MDSLKVWINNHPDLLFAPGTVTGTDTSNPKMLIVSDNKGNTFKIPKDKIQIINSDCICLTGDFLELDDLNQQSLLYNVRSRFSERKIYSSIGSPILLAVNPYQRLPIYNYFLKSGLVRMTDEQLIQSEPHIYKTAELSYRNLLKSNNSQNIIITGESGAGKTESTKFILDYIASRDKNEFTQSVSGQDVHQCSHEVDNLEKRILLANPVLEAFGNAKTIRNDNSSRFGKYIEIFFQNTQESMSAFGINEKKIAGARINNYLLENSRIDFQTGSEKNYHVFYQMIARANEDPHFAEEFCLEQGQEYVCVNLSESFDSDFFKEKLVEAKELDKNFEELLFRREEIKFIRNIISGIINLSNVKIESVDFNDTKSKITDDCSFFERSIKMFGLSKESLFSLICCKSITDPISKNIMSIPVDPMNAEVNKKTVAKMIYNQLFDWLVFKVNISISGEKKVNHSKVFSVTAYYQLNIT